MTTKYKVIVNFWFFFSRPLKSFSFLCGPAQTLSPSISHVRFVGIILCIYLDHRKSKMSRPLVSVYDPETADAVVGTVTLPVRTFTLRIEYDILNGNNRL